jgi:hypothetical protein
LLRLRRCSRNAIDGRRAPRRARSRLEWACSIYRDAAAIAEPRTLDAQQQAAFMEAIAGGGYGKLKPRVDVER